MSDPLWDETKIEDELTLRAMPLIMAVEEAKVVAMQIWADYEAALADLQQQLDELQNPADVTVTIGSEPCGVSYFVTGMQDVDEELREGSQAARDKLAAVCDVMATHVMNFGAPNLWPDESEPGPSNWDRLDQRMQMFLDMGAEPMLVFYNYPVWMREIVNKDGSTTPCDPADPFATEGRVVPTYYEQFYSYCYQIGLRYLPPPYSVRTSVLGNELKGYSFCRDGSDGFDIKDYTELYNIWLLAMEDAARALGISPGVLKLGGCYAPIRCEATPSKDTYPEGYPYGYYRWAAFEALEYFVLHANRADFIAFDCGSGNAEGGELVDTFTVQQTKFVDIANQVRAITHLPIIVTEFYPKTADDENANAQRVAAAKTVAHLSCIYKGYWMCWQWGAVGQGEYPELNTNGGMLIDYESAATNPWYDCYKILHDHFSAGAELYPVTVDGEGVYVGATAGVVVLVNMTDRDRSVRCGGSVHTLAPYDVREMLR